MALAVDSQESGGTAHRSTATPPTIVNSWTFVNTAGDLLLVGVVTTSVDTLLSINSVTYAGAALTALGSGQTSGAPTTLTQWFYKIAPATGSNTVTVTVSSAGASNPAVLAGAISFSGAHQTTPLGTEVKATGSGATSSTGSITSAATSFLVALVSEGSGTAPTQGSGNTLSCSLAGSGLTSGDDIGIEYWDSDGTSRNMQFTLPADTWGTVGVEVLAATGGGAGDLSVNSIGEPVIGGSTF